VYGVRVERAPADDDMLGPYPKFAGLRKNVEVKIWPTWPQNQTVCLEVDGPGGERVDEVAVSEGLEALALKASVTIHGLVPSLSLQSDFVPQTNR
jgi:hypothetical protein